MNKLLRFTFLLFVVAGLSLEAFAQQEVTIRDLNTYDNLTSLDDVDTHPLATTEVTFTAVVSSYVKNSGQSGYNSGSDSFSRVHFFVTDTSATAMGREGMSLRIVETEYVDLGVEDLNRGDIVEFTGVMDYYNNEAQFDVSELAVIANVNEEGYEQHAPLLDPIQVDASDLNVTQDGTTFSVNMANYQKYVNAYVELTNVVVSNSQEGSRPNWTVSEDGSLVYMNDLSLRYRNDRTPYRTGYNYIRDEASGGEGDFVPPPVGSVINISGYMTVSDFDAFGVIESNSQIFKLSPWDDGVVWLGETETTPGTKFTEVSSTPWPNDVEIVGFPPAFTNFSQTPSGTVTTSDAVVVSVDVLSQSTGGSITSVELTYQASGGQETTVSMANTTGDTYTYTFPTFSNFTSVTYSISATDDNGITGRYPTSGAESIFVADEAINAISVIQETGSGSTGPSPLAGSGSVQMDLSGLIVSGTEDGVVVLQDAAAPWSGVFLELGTATANLSRGDSVTITQATVVESEAGNSFDSSTETITVLTDITLTVNSSGNDISTVIPSLYTDDVVALQASGQVEPYEGMLIKFENAVFLEELDFGEFTIANLKPGQTEYSDTGVILNGDIATSENVGETPFSDFVSRHVRDDAEFTEVYGIMASNFNEHKVIPRSVEDLVGDNWAIPTIGIDYLTPEDSASVEVTDNVTITWEAAEDFDGDDVTYAWAIYTEADTTFITELPSDNEGTDPQLTLTPEAVDALLLSLGVQDGQSVDVFWNVKISDGADTLNASNFYDFDTQEFEDYYYFVTLVNSTSVANEFEGGVKEYALNQNYPNPFNPTTQISFQLPQSGDVNLEVFDVLGRKVATLLNEQLKAGAHTVNFDASRLASGIYIYRLKSGSFVSTRRMMLIK